MSFHALRIACRNCGSSFLFGGGGVSDMTFWKGCVASCHVCGAQIDASEAPTVPLRTNAPASPTPILRLPKDERRHLRL
jgi:hypothetical protein